MDIFLLYVILVNIYHNPCFHCKKSNLMYHPWNCLVYECIMQDKLSNYFAMRRCLASFCTVVNTRMEASLVLPMMVQSRQTIQQFCISFTLQIYQTIVIVLPFLHRQIKNRTDIMFEFIAKITRWHSSRKGTFNCWSYDAIETQ